MVRTWQRIAGITSAKPRSVLPQSGQLLAIIADHRAGRQAAKICAADVVRGNLLKKRVKPSAWGPEVTALDAFIKLVADREAFLKRLIAEHKSEFCISTGLVHLFPAVFTTKGNWNSIHVQRSILLDFSAAYGALLLTRLTGFDELFIGFDRKLIRIGLEGFEAILATKINFTSMVFGRYFRGLFS